ncbi:MAG: hypothetical protein DMG16_24135 [Acidobacteria bacterium]|nr:MAG: hypothetical protein DMG16_24135 [Acidobacteriota bacterium]
MRRPLLQLIGVCAVVLAVILLLKFTVANEASSPAARAADAPVTKASGIKTSWGEPDLQGIWTDEYQTPLQRPARYAGKEFFTDEERAALDAQRAATELRPRAERGTERDVAGAYNQVFMSIKKTGRRTSLIVDPPDGKTPPLTPEIQKQLAAEREFRLALLQATATCKNQEPGCRGGKYGPPSPRRNEFPPRYSTANINRVDNPEDRSMSERCMAAVLPDFTGFRRIVQSPRSVSIFYDVGQGQGWQRIIPVDGSPHLPSHVRQRFGDSRGHWEGETLVVDVTNFSPKSDFLGSRENRHLVERWTRTGPNTIEYLVTIEDPSTWTKPWTVKQEFSMQSNEANRIYYEPRCHDGNFGLPGLLVGGRAKDKAFALGQGPNPATLDNIKGMDAPEENTDPLAGGAAAAQ